MSGELVAAARKRKQTCPVFIWLTLSSSTKMIFEASYFSGQQILCVWPQTLNSSNPSRLFTLQDKFTSSLKTSLWQKIKQGRLWLEWRCSKTSCKIMLLYMHYSDTKQVVCVIKCNKQPNPLKYTPISWFLGMLGVQVRYPEFKCYEKCLCKCFLWLGSENKSTG